MLAFCDSRPCLKRHRSMGSNFSCIFLPPEVGLRVAAYREASRFIEHVLSEWHFPFPVPGVSGVRMDAPEPCVCVCVVGKMFARNEEGGMSFNLVSFPFFITTVC